MTRVFLKYNPYTVETEFEIDGTKVEAPNKLYDLRNERMQVWIENLVPMLEEICNDSEYNIHFYGTRMDYDDLASCVKEYRNAHKDINVTVEFTEAKGSEDRFSELVQLFEEMQEECPFEDLTTDTIKENFKNAISTEFEVSVIATMSSGKSTLINSLLGKELMPSKNEACTATIARIKDVDGKGNFSAEYRDKNREILGTFNDLTLENMNEMNDNPNTAYIDIEGDVKNINSQGVQLVLVDTPGPNNSRTEEHKNHTYSVIKDKVKPMVLYVLNATQLQTNDDRELLTAVAEAMKVGGKQSKDRFIFALNKIDDFDPDKESVDGAIENVKEYLRKVNIENPNIFPTSAEMAKVIRMSQNGQELTVRQKKTLRDYDLFIDEEQFHLHERASLSMDNKRRINEMIQEAKKNGDELEEAIIYTGIPAVELAIDEYLRKYAYTTKVKAAVDTFRKKVEEKDMHAKMIQSIENDEEARERINEQLKVIKALLEEGAEGQKFREKIEGLDMMKEANKRIAKVRAKISSALMNKSDEQDVKVAEAQRMIMRLENTVRNLQSDVKTELENIIGEVIVDNANEIIKDYQEHVHELITSGEIDCNEYNHEADLNFLEEGIPNTDELINAYKKTERVAQGVRKTINTEKKWYKPWTWFQSRILYETEYAEVEMVSYKKIFDEFVQPIMKNFMENLDNAKSKANTEADEFKKYFLQVLEQMEETMKRKVQENEELTRDQANIQRKIDEDKEKIQWLEEFLKKLDNILAI